MQYNDLISRAAIIRELERIRKFTKTLTGIDFLWMIETFPAVDAVPVVHGRWLREYDENDDEYIVCSKCGAKYESDIVFDYHDGRGSRLELEGLEHCPHCGALLDGGDDHV